MKNTRYDLNTSSQDVLNHFLQVHKEELKNFDFEITTNHVVNESSDAFEVKAQLNGSKVVSTISTMSLSGYRYALNAILKWIKNDANEDLVLSDQPHFTFRGVIEGFYGKPWSHEQRLRSLDFFGDFGMNAYFIAPKDAPWQRFNWRAPFKNDFLDLTRQLVVRGALNGVNVAVCVSPGLSVKYSDPSDIDAVITRYQQLYEIGVNHFGLLWDDISWELQHPEDIKQYSSTAKAHSDFSNKVYEKLLSIDSEIKLTVCPMHYNGRGVIPYIEELGSQLSPEINLMWTGRQICSEYLDISDAIIFENSAHRKPFYWDNFPVNDGSMQPNLYIGPIRGREKGLHNHSIGLLSNPMLQGEASLIPLSTVGEYLWNSEKYVAEDAWERALEKIIPIKDERTSLRHFFRTSLGSTVGGDPAPDLRKVFNEGVALWRSGKIEASSEVFRNAGNEIIGHYKTLMTQTFSNQTLIEEIKEWLGKYELGGRTLLGVADVLHRCTFDQEKQMITGPAGSSTQIGELLDQLRAHKKRLFGDQIEGPFSELIAELEA